MVSISFFQGVGVDPVLVKIYLSSLRHFMETYLQTCYEARNDYTKYPRNTSFV